MVNTDNSFIEMVDVRLHYKVGGGLASIFSAPSTVKAVDGVTVSIGKNESIGVLGESGCGKTSLGRLLLKLENPTAGRITFAGENITDISGARLKRFRRRAQLIFQNPYDAVNPRYTIRDTMAEPLRNAGIPRADHEQHIVEAMKLVHLQQPEQYLSRYPHLLSGGQLQRVVMARALVMKPEFIVADEPVSMLDVSVRAGVLNVFRDVQKQLDLTAIYISHDLALVRYVTSRTIVMYLGRIMEDGPTEDVVRNPLHPYTRALIDAVPTPDVDQSHAALPIKRGAPDARNPPSGCVFRDRCPKAFDRCAAEIPQFRAVDNHSVACHLYPDA